MSVEKDLCTRGGFCLLLSLTILLAVLAWPMATAKSDSVASVARPAVGPNALPVSDRSIEQGKGALPAGAQGTLTRAITAEPNSLDLPRTAETQAFTTAWQMYDSLVRVDDDGLVVPALAESWQVSQDGTEYTFHLRHDVSFHNGEAFNADAVVFSWQRARTGGFRDSHYWQRASSVEKTGAYTVTITTGEADGLFLRTVANHWAMIPPVYFQTVGQEGFEEHPIGTGPFMFVDWIAGDRITMEANPNYWRQGLPKIETVIFKFIPDSADRVTAIKNGTVDIATNLDVTDAQSLAAEDGIKVIKYPVDRVYYIAFNNLTTGVGQPTEDARVRQAMNYAVDVRTIIDTLFDGYARESTGFVTPANLGYDNAEPFGYDPARATNLLTLAGYPDGFEMDMACPAGAYRQFEEVCQAVAGYLGDVGLDVSLELMEAGDFWDLQAGKQLPPLFGDSWFASDGEAYQRLIEALGGWDETYSVWSDPVMDGLLAAIAVEVDQEKRAELYGQLQVTMRQNPPFIYLYEPFAVEAIDVQVQDYRPRAYGHYFLAEAWLDADGDGVPASVEDAAPNGGDGNADGVPDRDQKTVASLPNAAEGRYVTLESPDGTQLSSVRALENPSPADAPATATFPFGFLAFEVIGLEPGSPVSVTLSLPLEPELGAYWRYGQTRDDRSEHWYPFGFDGTTGAEISHELDQTRIVLHYVDGARGDGDLLADGQIVDPGAPAIQRAIIYLPLLLRDG